MSRRRDTPRFFCVRYLREQQRETRYLRLIGNGASLIRDIISLGKLPSLIADDLLATRTGEKKCLPRRWYAPDKTSGILTSTSVSVASISQPEMTRHLLERQNVEEGEKRFKDRR